MRLRSISQNDDKELLARCLSKRAIPNLPLILCNFSTESFQSHLQSLGLQFESRKDLNLSKREYGKRIAGYVGWRTFALYGVELDFAAKQLRLYSAKTKPSAFRGVKSIFIKEGGETLKSLTMSAGLTSQSNKHMIIDTGMHQSILSWLPPKYDKMLAARIFFGGFIGQEAYEMPMYLVPEFFIGNQRLTLCEVAVSERDDTNVIGLDILTCFHIFFDLPNKRIYLKPRHDKPNYVLPGISDVVLGTKRETLFISSILEDSASERAGLKKGDTILSVDGIPTAKHSRTFMQNILTGFTGTKAVVEVEHENGKRAALCFQRTDSYSQDEKTPPSRIGLTSYKDRDGKHFIGLIGVNSQSLKAGLRPGDHLVTLNGIAFTSENDAQLREIVRNSDNSELKLEVLRKGKPLTFLIPPRSMKTETAK